MPKILELEPHVADLIAAGEVVERPASVVKELIENSIDAGANIITVEINAGGMTYIRVTDNGCGMAPNDARTAFLRHATSKLRDAEGLEAIGTLGFRGEALAAIAAVSRIELLTRETGAGEGVRVSLEAGEVADVRPAGCPEGTTIIVRDLFFNTPARLKFMKSDRAEGSGVSSAVLHCALSRPEVSVRFIKDGKAEYHTPGDSRVDSCIYSLFGRDFSSGLLKAETEDETISTTGYISAPSAARGNRSYQFFFVNGRSIKSRTLQAAVEQAYANTLVSGRYPSCVLYIGTRLSDVDVNVHPAKTEVKFVSDKQVFDSVYYAALGAIRNMDGAVRSEGAPDREGAPLLENAQGQDGAPLRNNTPHSNSSPRPENTPNPEGTFHTQHRAGTARSTLQNPNSTLNSPEIPYQIQFDLTPKNGVPAPPAGAPASPAGSPAPPVDVPAPPAGVPASPVGAPASSAAEFNVIGEAMNTYIIVEYGDGVWFIDKHAAHERIHFDKLKREEFTQMSQSLMTPVVCRQGHDDAAISLENSGLLDKLGFTVESFGEDAVAVRSIPAEIDVGDAETVLSDICAQLKLGGPAQTERRDEIYRAIACKAAIKAGKSSAERELRELAARVISGEISHCPHGRPVAFILTKATLDRNFKRI